MKKEELEKLYIYFKENVPKIYVESQKLNNHEVEKKELNDIATFTDKYMEQEIIKLIKKLYPKHKIIGEEFGEKGESNYEWLIDPIDGTVNFAANIPMFGTSIGLKENNETIFGIIFDWPGNHIYYSIKGEGAYCDDKKLKVSNRIKLDECIVSICLTSNYNENYTNKVLNIMKKLQPHVRGIRVIVCTVYELMWLASGKTDVMINVKPSIGLSSAAGKLIITEAGGKITNLKNLKRECIDDLLISNSFVHNKVYQLIN